MKDNKKLVGVIVAIIVCIAAGVLLFLNNNKNTSKEQRNGGTTPPTIKANQELKLVKYADYEEKPNTIVDSAYFDDGYITFEKYNNSTEKYSVSIFHNGVYEKDIDENICPNYITKVEGKNELYNCYEEEEKIRLFNYKTQEVGEKVYSTIYDDDDNYGFILVGTEEDKYGLLDSKGNELLPTEYDSVVVIKTKDGKLFFVTLEIDDEGEAKSVILDENKNVVLDFESHLWYSDYYDKFYVESFDGENEITKFYSLNGEFIKEFNITELSLGEEIDAYYYSYVISDMLSYADENDKSTVYIIDDKLNVKKYENVYHNEEVIEYVDPDGEGEELNDTYYITDKFIVIKENDKYIVKSIASDAILGEYSSIEYIYTAAEKIDNKEVNRFFIVCKENNKCGIIDSSGNKIVDTIYEYNKENNQLKNNNEYVLIPGDLGNIRTTSCSSYNADDNLVAAEDYFFIVEDDENNYNVYNYQCEQIFGKTIYNYEYYNDGLLIAELDWNVTDDDIFVDDYAFFYKGKEITYKSEDNAKIHQLLGYNDKKIYFTTDKGIYYIDISSSD